MPRLLGGFGKVTPAVAILCLVISTTPAVAQSKTTARGRNLPDKFNSNSTAEESGFLFAPIISDRSNEDLLDSIEQYELQPPLAQVNSVNGLKDISPQDWAYEALRGLVERYDCVSGFPDRTYRGEQTISRYEFASSLNACLRKVESLIVDTDAILFSQNHTSKYLSLKLTWLTN